MTSSNSPAEKSSVEEIRQRFDADVERFSNLDTGQSAAIDAPLVLELIARSAAAVSPAVPSVCSTWAAGPAITRSSCCSACRWPR